MKRLLAVQRNYLFLRTSGLPLSIFLVAGFFPWYFLFLDTSKQKFELQKLERLKYEVCNIYHNFKSSFFCHYSLGKTKQLLYFTLDLEQCHFLFNKPNRQHLKTCNNRRTMSVFRPILTFVSCPSAHNEKGRSLRFGYSRNKKNISLHSDRVGICQLFRFYPITRLRRMTKENQMEQYQNRPTLQTQFCLFITKLL